MIESPKYGESMADTLAALEQEAGGLINPIDWGVLKLQKDDIVLMRCPERMSPMAMERVMRTLTREQERLGVKMVLVPYDFTPQVLRREGL